jgi:hypothetical protein
MLGVQNRLLNVDESIYIPITKGEFAVIVSTFNVSRMPFSMINYCYFLIVIVCEQITCVLVR